MLKFDFDGLFIFEMANNHQGSVEHGLKIIDELAAISSEFGIRSAVKLQFRELDTFIHPGYRDNASLPHIPRFMGTRLSPQQFNQLVTRTRQAGLVTMTTPFDEASVDLAMTLGVDVIKIGSCSARDWPLLEKAASVGKPLIVSTAGLNINDIDEIVSFLGMRHAHFALMHCVALYPTPPEKLQLNQIELLRRRFPELTIGFSTHEAPDFLDGVKMAYAKGARIFEKHVGLEAEGIKLNNYSASPAQIRKWIQSYQEGVAACGAERRPPASVAETQSLRSLRRGVFAAKDIPQGSTLTRDAVFFAMPLQDGQLESGDWKETLIADRPYKMNEPVSGKVMHHAVASHAEIISRLTLQIKGMLNEARIPFGKDFEIELSHHYGLERFREFGAVIIDCINRQYCKKLIMQLPRQKHPYHFHKRKEETFQVLYGDLEVEIDGNQHHLKAGDSLVIPQGAWHKFQTMHGVIFEEISTTHYNDDSFYEDRLIACMPREKRKTKIPNWSQPNAAAPRVRTAAGG